MLLVGRQTARTCQTLSRRAFLQVGASTVLGLSLADLLRQRADGSTAGLGASRSCCSGCGAGRASSTRGTRSRTPRSNIRGPFGTIPTRIPGVRFCELFPKLAGRHRPDRRHPLAEHRVERSRRRRHHRPDRQRGRRHRAGRQAARRVAAAGDRAPSWPGAASARARRVEAAAVPGHRRQAAPGQEADHRRGRRRRSAALYDPFRLEYDPVAGTKVPALQLPAGPDARPARRPATLLHALDAAERTQRPAARGRALDDYRRQAFAMLTSRQGAGDVRSRQGAGRRPRPLRPDALRPVVPAGPAAGRARRAVRAGELERPRRGRGGRRRRRLGPPLPQLPDHAGPPRHVARPGAVDVPARPGGARPARHDAGAGDRASSAARRRSTTRPGREHQPNCYQRPAWPAAG